jgi:energy-coupling factor transport system ATP-binding protein
MALIELKNVSYSYQDTKALSNLSFEIEKGEFVAIIGPNGSGKSTLAQHLNGLLLPTEGTVKIDGISTGDADSSQIWEIRRRVGMVFQNPDNQLVATTVEEDVAFGPENLGLPSYEIQSRVRQALCQVGMEHLSRAEPHKLSGGQKQRVAIAGVLAMEPASIVLDEPTAMLDPQGRIEVWDTLTSLNRKGITVILVTHFMEEAAMADRVLVLSGGELALEGTAQEIFSKAALLSKLGLELPQIAELREMLRLSGIPVPSHIFTPEAMVEWLCK